VFLSAIEKFSAVVALGSNWSELTSVKTPVVWSIENVFKLIELSATLYKTTADVVDRHNPVDPVVPETRTWDDGVPKLLPFHVALYAVVPLIPTAILLDVTMPV
jgi:hypothetical protein